MGEKEIYIEHKLESSHYNALRVYYLYRRKLERTKIMVCILLASLFLLILSDTAYGFPFFKLIGLTGMICIAVMYSWISIDARRLEKYARDIVNKKQEIIITSKGFSAKWNGSRGEEEYSWGEIDYVYEDDAYFFLFIDLHSVVVISKVVIKEQQLKDIRRCIEGNVKYVSDVTGFEHKI